MRPQPTSPKSKGLSWGTLVGALFLVAIIGVAAWRIVRTPGLWGWPAFCGLGALAVVSGLFILQAVREEHRIRRAVAAALRGRPPLTDEEFSRRFCEPALAPLAVRLRRMLAEGLDCDLSGMVPTDDFEQWLDLSSGPDSAADMFFEELAIEFQLPRKCPWPERFGSFDALVRFVAEHGYATRACV